MKSLFKNFVPGAGNDQGTVDASDLLTVVMWLACRFLLFHVTRLLDAKRDVPRLDRPLLDRIMVVVQDPTQPVKGARRWVKSGWEEKEKKRAEKRFQGRSANYVELEHSREAILRESPHFFDEKVVLPKGTPTQLRQQVAEEYLVNLKTHLHRRTSGALPTLLSFRSTI